VAGGHAAEPPSSGFAASPLRFDPFGMTASRQRGKWPPWSFGERSRPLRPRRSPKDHGKPSAIVVRSGQGRRSRPRSGSPWGLRAAMAARRLGLASWVVRLPSVRTSYQRRL